LIRVGVLLGGTGLGAAIAGSPAAAEDPSPRAGRLNYFSGEVRFAVRSELGDPSAADALDWNEASFNLPVCQDMSLKTGSQARALIRIGPNAIQLAGDTEFNMLNLTDTLIEASIRQGRIHLQLAKLDPAETVELESPRGSLWLLEPGGYDIEVGSADEPTRITVFEGKARFVGGQADHPIAAGEAAEVTGAYPAVVTAQRLAAPSPSADPTGDREGAAAAPGVASQDKAGARSQPSDDFLFWVKETEAERPHKQTPRHVPQQMTGSQDLDSYGRWRTLDDYGEVWFPSAVPTDWAPYRFGHWTTIAPWGWTWIDDQPWGFAPFHYGRWVFVDGRWGWAPGEPQAHPVYAPALVAFVDTSDPGAADPGPDAPVGWLPLAPGEPYVPWYAASPGYVRSVEVVYPARFRERVWRGNREAFREGLAEGRREAFANHRFATFVHRAAFAGGRSIDRAIMKAPAAGWRVGHRPPPMVPAIARMPPGARSEPPHGAASLPPGSGALRHSGTAGPSAPRQAGGAVPSATGAPGHTVGPASGTGAPPGAGGPTGSGGPRNPIPTAASAGGPHLGGGRAVGRPAPQEVGLSHPPARFGAGPGAPAFGAPMAGRGQQGAAQSGRAEIFHTPAPTARGPVPQLGQPQATRAPPPAGPTGMGQAGRAVAAPPARAVPVAHAPAPAARPAPARSSGGGSATHKK
jgi:hypothetical protein